MTTRHFLWAAALTLTVASVAMAQSRATTADVTGTVLDQTNAALPGATVTATNTGDERGPQHDDRRSGPIHDSRPSPRHLHGDVRAHRLHDREGRACDPDAG